MNHHDPKGYVCIGGPCHGRRVIISQPKVTFQVAEGVTASKRFEMNYGEAMEVHQDTYFLRTLPAKVEPFNHHGSYGVEKALLVHEDIESPVGILEALIEGAETLYAINHRFPETVEAVSE